MNFANYSKSIKDSGLPHLGFLVFPYIPSDLTVDHEWFSKLVDDCGADFVKLPKQPNSGDVFRRACTHHQRARQGLGSTFQTGLTANYMIRDTGYDEQEIHRTVVVEHVDRNQHVLHHSEIGKITFDKTLLTVNGVGTDTVFVDLVEDIRDFVKVNGQEISNGSLSNIFKSSIERGMVGTRLKPNGGLYFVGKAHAAKLDAFSKVANELTGVQFGIHPLLDHTEQRAMLAAAFEGDATSGIDSLIAEMIEFLRSGEKITDKRWAAFNVRAQEYKARVDEYSSLLDEEMGKASAGLELAAAQLMTLMNASLDD